MKSLYFSIHDYFFMQAKLMASLGLTFIVNSKTKVLLFFVFSYSFVLVMQIK